MLITSTFVFIAIFFPLVSAMHFSDFPEVLNIKDANLNKCNQILSSKYTRFFEQHFDNSELDAGNVDEIPILLEDGIDAVSMRRNSRINKIIRTLRSEIYAPKMCNAETYYPIIADELKSQLSCYEICERCVPDSVAVCHRKHPRFPGIGQTCFCTFNDESPLHKAVLVIKNPHQTSRPNF